MQSFLEEAIAEASVFLDKNQKYPEIPTILPSLQASVLECDEGPLGTFGSNDYLGLSRNMEVKQKVIEYLQTPEGTIGACRTPILGRQKCYIDAEKALSEFTLHEDAMIFSSAYSANLGVIRALVEAFPYFKKEFKASSDKQRFVIGDALNHASIVDAARASRADYMLFEHGSMKSLERLLEQKKDCLVLVVVDGIFSMDGVICPLDKVYALCQKYHAMLLVDDSHGFGIMGKTGRGTPEIFSPTGQKLCDVYLSSFTKACGSGGAFVAANKGIIDYLRVVARTAIFSDSMPPSFAVGIPKILEIFQSHEMMSKKVHLFMNAEDLRSNLLDAGFWVTGQGTPIVPILFKGEHEAKSFSHKLLKHKISAAPILHPAVPIGKERLRFSVTADHSSVQIESLIKACIACK